MKRAMMVFVLVAVVLVVGVPVWAQDAHLQAAEDFLVALKVPEQMKQATDDYIDLMLQGQPMMAPYRATIKAFYDKYVSWEALRAEYLQIVTGLWSEQDLKDLTAFFKGETGQKFVNQQGELFQKTSELGFRAAQEHQDELIANIQAEAEKYQAPANPAAIQ
ncbi:MAG TPA: DUF2059 domain-containing protein [Candidatus Omnitrophota bacterium]|jgi:hypothetical protein|nr:DUF2059 domain-containing protein [Candidatus Omnitrophota bacterium]HSA30408.1 DUF2059 domain-containing protein [Candidatus Omnitrophota bacterium]